MDPLNLILLIIVALIGWRLRSVLGTRNDDEKPGSRADAYRLNRDAYENRPIFIGIAIEAIRIGATAWFFIIIARAQNRTQTPANKRNND